MNKTLLKKLKFLLFFLLILDFANAQNAPFYSEIQQFKTQDSIHFPPKQAILFLGSSSFRKWEDVQKYFPDYKIINRGFGGSTIPDAIYYLDKIVFINKNTSSKYFNRFCFDKTKPEPRKINS
jgi:hypothetical protein